MIVRSSFLLRLAWSIIVNAWTPEPPNPRTPKPPRFNAPLQHPAHEILHKIQQSKDIYPEKSEILHEMQQFSALGPRWR